jgi:hypothetical protein
MLPANPTLNVWWEFVAGDKRLAETGGRPAPKQRPTGGCCSDGHPEIVPDQLPGQGIASIDQFWAL